MFFNLILEQKENKARARHPYPWDYYKVIRKMSGEDALALSQSVLALLFVFKPVDCRA